MADEIDSLRTEVIRLRNRLGICVHGKDFADCDITDEGCAACIAGVPPLEGALRALRQHLMASQKYLRDIYPDDRDYIEGPLRNPAWIVLHKANVDDHLKRTADLESPPKNPPNL